MIVNIMMLVAMYPMVMIVCFVMFTSMKPKNGMAFGAKLSIGQMQDETIREIERQWAAEMKRNIVITAVLPFISFLTPYVSVQITIWSMWCLALIVLLEYPFVKANARVIEVKRGMGWYNPQKPEEYVELKSAGEIRRVKVMSFLAPFMVSALAVMAVYGLPFLKAKMIKDADYVQGFGVVIVIFALCNLLFLAAALWMDKQKTEVISTKSDVNLNYARARKNIWKNFWLSSSWITTGYVWVCAIALIFQYQFVLTVLIGSVVYSIIVMGLLFPLTKKLRAVDAHYEKERDIVTDGDDDRYWIWGMLYHNPSDRHTMVSMRNGLGTTFNIATPVGKGCIIVSVLVMLSVPVLCGWMMFEEFTPISLSINENELHANHLWLEYELPVEEIENLELIEELPRMTKSVGTGMEHLLKGTFIAQDGTGKCQVFLNPQNGIFMKLSVADTVYYLGGRTDEETMEVYEAIR